MGATFKYLCEAARMRTKRQRTKGADGEGRPLVPTLRTAKRRTLETRDNSPRPALVATS